MKILYLFRNKPDETVNTLIDLQRKDHEVMSVELGGSASYNEIVAMIEQADRVISW